MSVTHEPASLQAGLRASSGTRDLVLLRAGRLQILVPREDVGAAHHFDGTVVPSDRPGQWQLPDRPAEEPAGQPALPGTRYLGALSPLLEWLAEPPAGRFLMTSFTAQPDLCLCWDEVRVLPAFGGAQLPLPPAMICAGSPFAAFVELGDQIAFCTTGERLLAHALRVRS